MKKIIMFLIAGLYLFVNSIHAAPIDFSGWTTQAWDYSGNPQGNWVVSADKTSVIQTLNADASAFLNGVTLTDYIVRGSFKVNQSGDDDDIGFVFGYQNASNFYVFDWKQGNQLPNLEGFSVRKISASSVADLVLADFQNSPSSTNMTIINSDFRTDNGWVDFNTYDFFLDFKPGNFQVKITEGALTLYDVVINDGSFLSGQFGLWNNSQPNAQYFNLDLTERNQGPENQVPEPSILMLLGLGMFGILAAQRKFKK